MKLLKEKKSKKSSLPKRLKNHLKNSNILNGPRLRSKKIQCINQNDSSFEEIHQQMQSEKNQATKQKRTKQTDQNIILQQQEKLSNALQQFYQAAQEKISNFQIVKQIQAQQFQVYQQNDLFITPIKRKKRQNKNTILPKIFFCQKFQKVKEIDFLLYFKILSKAKMYSTLLINQLGQVIFADRLGSQHFEGSLNNLSRNPIYTMILQCRLKDFFQKISDQNFTNTKVLKLLIYSKNSKRRYSKASNQISMTKQDIFNRYLKCVSCQILPIEIKIQNLLQIEGFWNKQLIPEDKILRCYLFKSRLARDMPDLCDLELVEDKKIIKFLNYTKRKQAQKQFEQLMKNTKPFNFSNEFRNSSSINNEKMSINEQLEHNRDDQQIFQQMKQEKTGLTRRGIINSGEGKERKNEDI